MVKGMLRGRDGTGRGRAGGRAGGEEAGGKGLLLLKRRMGGQNPLIAEKKSLTTKFLLFCEKKTRSQFYTGFRIPRARQAGTRTVPTVRSICWPAITTYELRS